MTHSNERSDTPKRDGDHNHDDFEKRLRDRLFEVVPSAAVESAGDRVWGAIQNELNATSVKTESDGILTTGLASPSPSHFQSIFQYRNLLCVASSVLIMASSAQFYVAFKQQQDGIVVSTVKRSAPMVRASELARPNRDWLPEEREIWRRLSEQLSQREGDEIVFKTEVWDSLKSR